MKVVVRGNTEQCYRVLPLALAFYKQFSGVRGTLPFPAKTLAHPAHNGTIYIDREKELITIDSIT